MSFLSTDSFTYCLNAGKGFSSYCSKLDLTIAPADLFRLRKEPLVWILVGLPVLGEPVFGLWYLELCNGDVCDKWGVFGVLELRSGGLNSVGEAEFLWSVSSMHSSFLGHTWKAICELVTSVLCNLLRHCVQVTVQRIFLRKRSLCIRPFDFSFAWLFRNLPIR